MFESKMELDVLALGLIGNLSSDAHFSPAVSWDRLQTPMTLHWINGDIK